MLPVFVISLKGETTRREKMTLKLDALGLPFSFFDAVDGRQFNVRSLPDYRGLTRRLWFGKDLTGGEMGCIRSHRAIFEKIVTEKIPAALVLEDDAILKDDFPKILQSLLSHDYPWQMVRFLGSPKVSRLRQRRVADLGDGYSLTRLSTSPGGAHAYVVKYEAAKILAAHMQTIAYPNDTLMGRPWVTGLPVLTVQPGLAIQDLSLESAIGEERFQKNKLKGWEALAYPLTRAGFKAYESAMKRAYYWAPYFKDKHNYLKVVTAKRENFAARIILRGNDNTLADSADHERL